MMQVPKNYTRMVAFQGMHVLPAKHGWKAKYEYQESVTTRKTHGQMPEKVIRMCCYASQAIQKKIMHLNFRQVKKLVTTIMRIWAKLVFDKFAWHPYHGQLVFFSM